MSRYTGPACKICRREAGKLFLKGDRCYTDKCAFERREYPPGSQGVRRGKVSEYAMQLREKQKVKRTYGLVEKQFRNLFEKSERMKGVTGDNLIGLLERRLDNVVYRLGFAASRADARMMVTQGHFLINGKKVDIPSYTLTENDIIELQEGMKAASKVADSFKSVERRGVPEWLAIDKDKFKGSVMRLPLRDDVTMPIEEHLIVELYSK